MAVSGEKIKQARLALKERSKGRQGSQTWLAQQISAHPTSVSDWERGANQPSPRHLAAIASALGVSIESLMSATDEEEDSELPSLDVALRSYLRRLIREEVQA